MGLLDIHIALIAELSAAGLLIVDSCSGTGVSSRHFLHLASGAKELSGGSRLITCYIVEISDPACQAMQAGRQTDPILLEITLAAVKIFSKALCAGHVFWHANVAGRAWLLTRDSDMLQRQERQQK